MLDEMRIFLRAVDLGSISAAARATRITAAAASHRIAALEREVGARLLNRTTRSLRPTEAGVLFYDHAVEVLDAVERAKSSVAVAGGMPTGALRVTAPLGLGRRLLAPLVPAFRQRYPEIEVRLRLSDHSLDLLSEAVDIAIRMANPTDSSLIMRKLCDCPRVICASPDYLARHAAPRTPHDLLAHNCLLLRFPGSTQFRWTLTGPDGPVSLPVAGRFDADDGDVLTDWALQSEGVVMKPRWEVAEHLRDGRLVELLPDHPPEPVSLSLLYPHRRFLPIKVRVFADFIGERIGRAVSPLAEEPGVEGEA